MFFLRSSSTGKIWSGCLRFLIRPSTKLFALMENIKAKVGSYAFVQECYDVSTNKYKRHLSNRNYGVASCLFIDEPPIDIPHMELNSNRHNN
jgi:hypothetical protein